jgi:hypothetical protein
MTVDATVRTDSGYFVRNGQRWFPTGWCASSVDDLTREDLRRMAAAGCNLVRVWPDPRETGEVGVDLHRLLVDAEAEGVMCLISALNPGELSNLFIDEPNLVRTPNAYRQVCGTPSEVISSNAAREISRERLRRLVDLVGDSPAVFGWEVGNQVDGIYQASLGQIEAWTHEMCRFLRQEEERRGCRRLVTVSSFDPIPIWSAAFDSPDLDFVALHCYTAAAYSPVDGLQAACEMAATVIAASRLRAPGRPILDTEHGPILHQFLPDYPPLPPGLVQRYRRNLSAAHLCSGGAGGPLLIPPVVRGGPHGVLAMTDQLASAGEVLSPVLEPGERTLRKILDDPVLRCVASEPIAIELGEAMVGSACGSASGNALIWVAADSRTLERMDLLKRGIQGDPAVEPLLAYDAGRRLLADAGLELWNPASRATIPKLMAIGAHDVIAERAAAEIAKLDRLLGGANLRPSRDHLGGMRLGLDAGSPRTVRCYDLESGVRVFERPLGSQVELPELPGVVLAVESAERP